MKPYRICYAGQSRALSYALPILEEAGISLTDTPDPSVTHLLLPCPSFDSDGKIRGGAELAPLLAGLPADVTVIGGLLDRQDFRACPTVDLLDDPIYLSMNANITAHCALYLAFGQMPLIAEDCRCLVIGWGRIGKCLARLLRQLGADVTVAARRIESRACAQSLGFSTVATSGICLTPYRIVFNTVPAAICPESDAPALKIDLASQKGLAGADVIWARGLPAKMAPESSGMLIAQTVLRKLKECEV